MSSKRILVVMMAILAALASSSAFAADGGKKAASKAKTSTAAQTKSAEAAAPTATEKMPRLTIVEPVHDYGTVSRGDTLKWAFEVKNTGDADLQILAARPGCGCTVADFDKVIKPGETGKVTAQVDTTNFTGPIAKAITVETNDPNTPSSTLTIHAVVKPYVEAYPAGFVRYNLLQGDAEQQSIVLYSEEETPFEITKVEVPVEWVKANYTRIEDEADRAQNVGRPGQNQYKLNIVVGGPNAKLGPIAEKIKIYTNSRHQPEYSISVVGVIRPPFRVEPASMNFGEVTPTDVAASRSVMLRSNDLKAPEKFAVTKAESSTPLITTAVKPGANKGEFDVTMQVAKDAKPGDVEGTVKIYTNNSVIPVVTVPVKATIKAATTASAATPGK